jgi:usherin
VSNISAHAATFTWIKPSSTNGIILKYELISKNNLNPGVETMHYSGLALNYSVVGLIAYTNYTFRLSVCTQAGCLFSDWQVVITGEAGPMGQAPPTVVTISDTELFVSWLPPKYPNGMYF